MLTNDYILAGICFGDGIRLRGVPLPEEGFRYQRIFGKNAEDSLRRGRRARDPHIGASYASG